MTKLIRRNSFLNEVLFVDGQPSSGKVLMSKILESYEGIEKSMVDTSVSYVIDLKTMKLISDDTFKALIKTIIDEKIYYLSVGRDVNFRLKDGTSVFKNPFFLRYIKRAMDGERGDVLERIIRENTMFQEMLHCGMIECNLLQQAFKNRMKYIYVDRNPIDLLYYSIKREFGKRIGMDMCDFQLTYKTSKTVFPKFAIGNEDIYDNGNDIDRAIIMTDYCDRLSFDAYYKLKKKDNFLIIDFDNLIKEPKNISIYLEDFLGRKRTFKTNKVLRTINSKYTLNSVSRNIQLKKITDMCSNSGDILDKLVERYENRTSNR